MRALTLSEHISRSPGDVFAFIMDFSRASRWRSLVRRIELATPGPVTVGSELLITFDAMGRVRQQTSRIWAYDPPRRLGLTNTASRITGIFEYTLTPDAQGTRVSFTTDIRPRGLVWLAMPWVLRGHRARYKEHLARLKQEIEGPKPDR